MSGTGPVRAVDQAPGDPVRSPGAGPQPPGSADLQPPGSADESSGDADESPGDAARPTRRRRRAVRPGTGDPDPPSDRRSADDTDLGWEPSPGHRDADTNDERLRRDVPPHW